MVMSPVSWQKEYTNIIHWQLHSMLSSELLQHSYGLYFMFQDLRFWHFWNVLPVKVQMVSYILKELILARQYCIPSQKTQTPFFVFPIHLGMVFEHSVLYPLHKVKVGINILDENIKWWDLFFSCSNEVTVKLTMMGGRGDLQLNIGSELGCVWTNWAPCQDSFTYEIKCTGCHCLSHRSPDALFYLYFSTVWFEMFQLGREESILRQWLDVCVTEGGILVAQQRLHKRPLLVAQMVEEWLNHYRRLAWVDRVSMKLILCNIVSS